MTDPFRARRPEDGSPGDALDRIVAFVVLLLAVLMLTAAARADERDVDVVLVLAADVSGSMSEEALRLQRDAYSSAFGAPEVQAAIRAGLHGRIAVALLEWSSSQTVVVPWTAIEDEASAARFQAAAREAPPPPFRTATGLGDALMRAGELLDAAPFRGRRVVDVSGDGPTNYGLPTEAARALVCDGRTTVNGLPIRGHQTIGEQDVVEHYEQSVVCGPGAFLIAASGMTDFREALRRKLVLEIAGGPPTRLVASR